MDERERKKIPYDAAPITREYNVPMQGKNDKKLQIGSLPAFVIAILVVFNIILGAVLINFVNKPQNNNVVNLTYNVSPTETSEVVVAASKAKLSAVVIGVGGSNSSGVAYSSTNVPTYNQLLSTDSRGAGVIIGLNKSAGEAYILTCDHVVYRAPNAVFVCLYDSYTPMYATVIGESNKNDIALLKVKSDIIKTASCTAASVANSAYVTEGDTAIAVGNPQSNGFSVTSGVVSRLNTMVSASYGSYSIKISTIQVDTAINSGNSGGGLFDGNGNLIGIVESKTNSASIDNVAYAVPINRAMSIALNFIDGRHEAYAKAGYSVAISGSTINEHEGKILRIPTIVVTSVQSGSDAANAGIEVGDRLVSFSYNNKTVEFTSEYSYEDEKYSINIGDTVSYKIIRNGSEMIINVVVTELYS